MRDSDGGSWLEAILFVAMVGIVLFDIVSGIHCN
jgi:hypothetical protein